MQDNNSDDKRPSLIQFLMGKELKNERIMFLVGMAIVLIGAWLVPGDTLSMIVIILGSLIIFSVTDSTIKKMPK